MGFEATGSSRAAIGLDQLARIVGAYRWIEQQLFEVLGTWVGNEQDDGARVHFDVQSQQHAWHAQLFADRLPVLDGMDPDSVTVAPSKEVQRFFEVVAEAGPTLCRLSAVTRSVLPRLVTGYSLHLEVAGAVADAPLSRALRLVVRDEIESWQSTEELFEKRVGGVAGSEVASGVREVSDQLLRLDELLVGTGPGLVGWAVSPGGR